MRVSHPSLGGWQAQHSSQISAELREKSVHVVDRLSSLLCGDLVWIQVRNALLTLASHLRATVIQYAFNEAINTGE